ncbi:MAG TPA: DUF4389 domain-containing protein [Acidimicrobiales bacterium]|nr:DUF4389 domain-containing protein [Acidimicrobiales bacterium]
MSLTPTETQGAPTSATPPTRPPLIGPANAHQSRLSILVRLLLALPSVLWLGVCGIAAVVVVPIAWLSALVLGRVPGPLADFLEGYVNLGLRCAAYLSFVTGRFPGFRLAWRDELPRLVLERERLNRLAVLLRAFLGLPAYLLATVVDLGATVFSPIAWLVALVGGRLPRALFQAEAAALRFHARTNAYLLLVTPAYPAGLFGDPVGERPGGVDDESAARPLPGHLSGGARLLLGVFILLGLCYSLLDLVAQSTYSAAPRAELAYSRLSDAFTNWSRAVRPCASSSAAVACVARATAPLQRALVAFEDAIESMTVPPSAAEARAALASSAGVAATEARGIVTAASATVVVRDAYALESTFVRLSQQYASFVRAL